MGRHVVLAVALTLGIVRASQGQTLPPIPEYQVSCPPPIGGSAIAWMLLKQPNVVAGRVVGVDGLKPIEGAAIDLLASRRAVNSNAEGRFTLDSIRPGLDTLRIRAIGYIAARTPVRLSAENGVMAFIVLAPHPVMMDGCAPSVPATRPPSLSSDVPLSKQDDG